MCNMYNMYNMHNMYKHVHVPPPGGPAGHRARACRPAPGAGRPAPGAPLGAPWALWGASAVLGDDHPPPRARPPRQQGRFGTRPGRASRHLDSKTGPRTRRARVGQKLQWS